ncbi:pyridoxal kinase PdxY [Spirochaetia bacterium]|nr:pyridoxal kinase PdxY [Spirochaetia bacterium]
MQRLGRDVWAINTVEFSNHTGYKAWRGEVLRSSLVDDLVQGLDERGVLPRCEAVLSGYLGAAETGRAILNAVKKVKAASPSAIYCCDPVMGDVGRGFYVHEGILPFIKNEGLPFADIITPNKFELDALTGIDSSSAEGARTAIKFLHDTGITTVLVTSYTGSVAQKDTVVMLASSKTEGKIWQVTTPYLPVESVLNGTSVAGTGDLTTAVFLSHLLAKAGVKRSLELTASAVFGIIEHTFNKKSGELLTVAAQDELINPRHKFEAVVFK